MLKGRLGLEAAELPHQDRHGFLALAFGRLEVEDGCLVFRRDRPEPGELVVSYQTLSCVLLEPGTSVTHDALRLLARHGVGLVATGLDGVKAYTAPPLLADRSDLARRQARAWADPELRLLIAIKQYERRFDERPETTDLNALRGMEGARLRTFYSLCARQHGIAWDGRHTHRHDPAAADTANAALNYASDAMTAAAAIAVSITATIPQLGFLHEDSGQSFVLDIADLYRTELTVPAAFAAAADHIRGGYHAPLERMVRQSMGTLLKRRSMVARMIEDILALLS